MGFFDWLGKKLMPKQGTYDVTSCRADEATEQKIMLDAYAMFTAVNLIANLISGCEFRTFRNDTEIHGAEWAALNIKANRNQNGAEWKHELVSRLLLTGEVLCVQLSDGQRLIADGFSKEDRTLYDSIFTQVSRDGLTLTRTYYSGDVIYMQSPANAKQAWLQTVMAGYERLMRSSADRFVNADGERGILTISALAQGDRDFEGKFTELMNNYFKGYFKSKNAVLPLYEGYSYDVKNTSRTGAYTNDLSAVKTLADEAVGRAAQLFGIPPSYIRGDAAGIEDTLTAAVTNCIKPLAGQISAELTSKLFTVDEIGNGSRITVDTASLIYHDPIAGAERLSELYGAGWSRNEINHLLGQPRISESWADEHFVTRNYGEINSVIAEGGEDSEQNGNVENGSEGQRHPRTVDIQQRGG